MNYPIQKPPVIITIGAIILLMMLFFGDFNEKEPKILREEIGIPLMVFDSKNYPSAERTNKSFDRLYTKFGLEVPNRFVSGEIIRFNDIYENIDYLTDTIDTATQEAITLLIHSQTSQ